MSDVDVDVVERDPRRGWWTPVFREWVEGHIRGECPWELDKLDELAQLAGDELQGDRQQADAIAVAALAVSIAVDEKRWRAAHEAVDALLRAVDELRDTDAPR